MYHSALGGGVSQSLKPLIGRRRAARRSESQMFRHRGWERGTVVFVTQLENFEFFIRSKQAGGVPLRRPRRRVVRLPDDTHLGALFMEAFDL